MSVRRGSVVWVDLGAGVGSEGNHRRPAIVVSNDGANSSASNLGQGVITVVPMTSAKKSPYPFQVGIPAGLSGLRSDSVAQAEQVRSVDVKRVSPTGRTLPAAVMADLSRTLSVHLSLL